MDGESGCAESEAHSFVPVCAVTSWPEKKPKKTGPIHRIGPVFLAFIVTIQVKNLLIQEPEIQSKI
jgi:hypothetical protein